CLCRDAVGRSTCQAVRIGNGPSIIFGTIYTIGVACEGGDTLGAIERHRERKQKLDVSAAPARSGNRDGCFTSRQKDGGGANETIVHSEFPGADLKCNRRVD